MHVLTIKLTHWAWAACESLCKNVTVVYHRRIYIYINSTFWRLSFPFSNRSQIDIFSLLGAEGWAKSSKETCIAWHWNRAILSTVPRILNMKTFGQSEHDTRIRHVSRLRRSFPIPKQPAGRASLVDIISPRFLPFFPTAKTGPRLGGLLLNKNSSLKFRKFHVHFNNHTH